MKKYGGVGLLRNAVFRTRQAAEIVGIGALLAHAISGAAKRLYEAYGFRASPVDPTTLLVTTAEAEKILGGEGEDQRAERR